MNDWTQKQLDVLQFYPPWCEHPNSIYIEEFHDVNPLECTNGCGECYDQNDFFGNDRDFILNMTHIENWIRYEAIGEMLKVRAKTEEESMSPNDEGKSLQELFIERMKD